jgi:sterol desaturase/sphingolipid hydroxylase (fatty acid hydroxylase superfamily)
VSVAETLGTLTALVADELFAVLRFPLDANKRVYAGYLLSTLVLATAVYLRRRPRTGAGSAWACCRYLFNPRIWWHPSARLDYQLMALNPLIQAALASFGALSVVAIAITVSDGLGERFGAVEPALPAWAVTALFTAALFVADDFTRYILHWMMHRIPCLWALHKLHHSAEVLTPATVYRIHPLESFLYSSRLVLTQGAVIGVFFYGFGMRLSAWDIAGANLFTFLFNLAGANLRHSHIRLSYGPWLERVFISPSQHQIHHSNRREHFDRNFGSCLALWDGLFGTLTLAQHQRWSGFGLGRHVPNPHSGLWRAYWVPLAEAVRSIAAPFRRRSTTPAVHHAAFERAE